MANPTPTRVRFLVLALACGISFVLYLHRYVWGFVKEDIRKEFKWGTDTLGWLDGLFPLTYGFGQIPAGMLCDWFGTHLLLAGSVLGWSLALAATVIATGFLSMAAARVALGVTQASCYPALNKVSKNWFPLDMRPVAQGLIATFFGRFGGAAAFFLFGTVLIGWLRLDWREAVGVFSAAGLACGAAFLLLFRTTPREHPWANAAEAELIVHDDPAAAHATRSVLNWGRLVRCKTVWFLFARGTMSNLADVLYVYWIPLYLRQLKGLDESATGALAALPLIGGALGGLASGSLQSYLLRRTGNRTLARCGVGGSGKLIAAGLMAGSLAISDATLLTWTFLVVKFFSDMEQPAEWGTISDIAGRCTATVFACVNTIGSLGGTLGGIVFGYILRAHSVDDQPTAAGWDIVFLITAAEYLLAAVCWLWINPTRPIDAADETR